MSRRKIAIGLSLITLAGILLGPVNKFLTGRVVDTYRGAKVFGNGLLYFNSYGRNYAADGYYFGQKWQCVEFVKRFYFETRGHRMPQPWGHAKDFFDPAIKHRKNNPQRGMIQFVNGGNEAPQPDDLLVFKDSEFGHVAIISKVTINSVEVVQQNIFGKPREKFDLKRDRGRFVISSPRAPAGWLRIPAEN